MPVAKFLPIGLPPGSVPAPGAQPPSLPAADEETKKKEEEEKKQKKKAERDAARNTPLAKAHEYLKHLPKDLTEAKQVRAQARASTKLRDGLKEEYEAMFAGYEDELVQHRATIEDLVSASAKPEEVKDELEKALDCVKRFRMDSKAFSKSQDVYSKPK